MGAGVACSEGELTSLGACVGPPSLDLGQECGAVSHYRLYFLDRGDHIRRAVSLECRDDAEAIGLIEAHKDGRTLELWQGARQVIRVEADVSPQGALNHPA